MAIIKDAGADKLKSSEQLANRTSRGSSKKATATDMAAALTADDVPKEVPSYLMACFKALTNELLDREDTKRQELKCEIKAEMRAEFQGKLDEKDAKIAEMDATISELTKKVRQNHFILDSQAQYARSENIKIHGIEYDQGEDTNEIVKNVFKYCGVSITDNDISVSHRMMSKEKMDTEITPANCHTKIPAIIARVSHRDFKSKLQEAKKTITTNTECPPKLKKAMIYEDVTPLRSKIMYQLRNRDNKEAFRFVWSKGGRIYARTPSNAALPRENQGPPIIINTPHDLVKAGFSKDEIEGIINSVRH